VRYWLDGLPFAVLWLAWLAYWLIAARNVKATRRSEPFASRLVTVALTAAAGALLAILGTALAFGEWRGMLAFGLLTCAFTLKLRREERFMRESFPNDYPRYCAQVPALVPFVRGIHRGVSV